MFGLFNNKEKTLERAKQKLLADLETKGAAFVVDAMNSNDIYSPLLEEKRKSQISSEDEVSWYAYRRAEKLDSPADKTILLLLLQNDGYTTAKRHIYFCLAHYCKNTVDHELFHFLMGELETDMDDDHKLMILIGIAGMQKSSALNIEPIKKLVEEGTRDIQINAILALKNTNDPGVEDLLIEEFKFAASKHLQSMICSTLKTIGTAKSIPYLKEAYKGTRDSYLKMSIEETIDKINGREKTSSS